MSHFAPLVATMDVQFGTQSEQFVEGREVARVFPQSNRQFRPINRECESGKVCTSVQMLRNGSFYNARINREKRAKAASRGGLAMTDLEFPEWQGPYLEALMETDQRKLVGRVDFAERAILGRLKEIQSSSKRHTEEQAIEDALRGLIFLKRETLEFKGSQGQLLTRIQSRVN
jgi:hypothetical protein